MLQLMQGPMKTLEQYALASDLLFPLNENKKRPVCVSLTKYWIKARGKKGRREGNEDMEGDSSCSSLFSVNHFLLISSYPPLYPEAQLSKPLTSPLLYWMRAGELKKRIPKSVCFAQSKLFNLLIKYVLALHIADFIVWNCGWFLKWRCLKDHLEEKGFFVEFWT